MPHSDENPDQSGEVGTPHFRTATEASNSIHEDEQFRKTLEARREIAMQIFHFMGEPMPFLEEDPDKWVIAIMDKLRPAANHLQEPDVVRMALCRCGAAVIASIIQLDELCRENGFIVPK